MSLVPTTREHRLKAIRTRRGTRRGTRRDQEQQDQQKSQLYEEIAGVPILIRTSVSNLTTRAKQDFVPFSNKTDR
jgi:hypothetical protein